MADLKSGEKLTRSAVSETGPASSSMTGSLFFQPCPPAREVGEAATARPDQTFKLAIASLGVVYGDIGTSPLYAVRECFNGPHGVALTPINVFGVMSLIFWSLTIVISIKYVAFVLRADNRGEGGIFALLGLTAGVRVSPRMRSAAFLAAIFGASLLYGDGIITPAISVLSAIEGLQVATHRAQPFVVPLTCGVLVSLFLLQKGGTSRIGKVFGPIMVIWFVTIGSAGLLEIFRYPGILAATNPRHAMDFFSANHLHGFIVLGSVVLCITGGEALYADLGHFGRGAIRLSWLSLAFPALLSNYFGQCAVLLSHPASSFHPFYSLYHKNLLYPMVSLATIATVIASQALISGAFSLTQQAIQLGFSPRIRIVHTSADVKGQIFVPSVNFALMVACLLLVLYFKESSRLAGAYGMAETATMILTSGLYLLTSIYVWRWPLWKALPPVCLFLVFDLSFFSANLFKFFDGGWITLVVAGIITVVFITWKKGRQELKQRIGSERMPLETFLSDESILQLTRVKGAAVFMTLSPEGVPSTLLHNVKHNQVLHEYLILLTIQSADVPSITDDQRIRLAPLGHGFYRLLALYGYMETPNVPRILKLARRCGLQLEPNRTSFYIGRETFIMSGGSRLTRWRKELFAFMSRNAANPIVYFGIPPNRVVELGAQIRL